MSYKATAWAYDLPLRGPAKPVLVALADFADEAGSCYPGQERLCDMTGLSLRSVQRALQRLEQMDLIHREHRYDRRGYRTSDRYVLSLDTQVLPVTEPSSHSAFMSDSRRLHATQSSPTRQSDGVTISRTTSDQSEGENAPTPDQLGMTTLDNGVHVTYLEPWCKRHAATEGTDKPCVACKRAALIWEQSLAATSHAGAPVPSAPSKHWKPGLCIPHLQKLGECSMCEREGIA